MQKKSIERTDERFLGLLEDLCIGLSENIYPQESKGIIEETRVIVDLKSLAFNMRDIGSSTIQMFYSNFPKFKRAIENIPIQTIQTVSEDELKYQYRLFLDRLFNLTKH